MCKLGDIIVVKEFKDKTGEKISQHSFVVINDKSNFIEGYSYDFVTNVMCSFHNKNHKRHKLSIKSNLKISHNNLLGKNLNLKEGYIRADELFYFNKKIIKYKVIAHLNDEYLNKLIKLIIKLDKKKKLIRTTTNL